MAKKAHSYARVNNASQLGERTYKVLSTRHGMGDVLVIEGKGLSWDEAEKLIEKLKEKHGIAAWSECENR